MTDQKEFILTKEMFQEFCDMVKQHAQCDSLCYLTPEEFFRLKCAAVETERDRYKKALLDIKSRVLVIDAGQGTVNTMLQYIREDINKALKVEK